MYRRSLPNRLAITFVCVDQKPTPKGFEPSRAEPSGFLVHLLNHSDTVSLLHHADFPALPAAEHNNFSGLPRKTLENLGIDPSASRMLSERSTI